VWRRSDVSRYTTHPVTVFCASAEKARELAAVDPKGCALVTPPGTMAFHLTLAQHGAGEFTTMYVAPELRGRFMPPCGGTIEERL
jgi:hypothetical protein